MSAIEVTQPIPMVRAEGRHARWTPITDTLINAVSASTHHVARSPIYYGRVAQHAPRGTWEITKGSWRWFSDADGRKALRSTFDSDESFLRARTQHREEIKARAFISLIGGVVGTIGGAVAWSQMPDLMHPITLGTFAAGMPLGLGLIGKPEGERTFEDLRGRKPKGRLHADDIVRALLALDIPKISKAIKDDDRAIRAMVGFDSRTGNHQAIVDLPGGATADEVMRRHAALCSALRRHQSQVLITQGRTADQVIIKISKERAGERKPAVSPVLKAETIDVSEPIVIGTDAMGDPVGFTLDQGLFIVGKSGSGKTVAVQNVISSALLDPTAEVWLWDGKGGGDHTAFQPALSVAIIGVGAEDADMPAKGVAMLKALSAECGRRSNVLREMGAAKVTAELARNVPGLHPLVCIVDEAQYLLSDPDAKRLVAELIKRVRSANIRLVLATQAIDGTVIDHSLPGLFRKRLALQLSQGAENTTMLGNGSVRQGFDAVAIDRVGEAIVAGEDGGLRRLQVFDLTEGQQESIVNRALAMRGGAVTKVGMTSSFDPSNEVEKEEVSLVCEGVDLDILRDILAVTEPDAVLVQTDPLCELLRQSAGDYQRLRPNDLRIRLRELGIRSRQVNRRINGEQDNKRGIVLDDIRAALKEAS